MDSKTLRLAILLSVTAIALILLVVYAANGGGKKKGQSAGGEEAGLAGSFRQGDRLEGLDGSAITGDGAYLTVIGDNFKAYGEQIGNQPKAFLYDESFFDPMRDVTAISDGGEEELTLTAVALADTVHVSIQNSRGGLETGTAFQIQAEQVKNGREKTWTDTDRDGQIDMSGLESGNYRIKLLPAIGYQVPGAPVVVKVDAPAADPTGAASSAASTGASAEDKEEPENQSSDLDGSISDNGPAGSVSDNTVSGNLVSGNTVAMSGNGG